MGAAATFNAPHGVALDSAGVTFVADTMNNLIRRITANGDVTTFAGYLASGHVDGQSGDARFSYPSGLVVAPDGALYVADSATIRKITPNAIVSTFVGLDSESGNVDGVGAAARVQLSGQLAIDSAGNLYFAQSTTHTIRKVTPQGVVTTIAGAGEPGENDGIGTAARFSYPLGTAVDGIGNVYVADSNNHTIRKIAPDGTVTTMAGKAGVTGNVDGVGSAARFFRPMGIAADAVGTLYVADQGNHTIRAITPGGVVTTIGGVALFPANTDGVGAAARFYQPTGIAVDAAGNLVVADLVNHGIRRGVAARSTPVISWAQPVSPIAYGTALPSGMLNATANIAGKFSYVPAAGAVLPVGDTTIKATFVPEDTLHYAVATAQVTVTVFAVKPVFTATPEDRAVAAGGTVTLSAAATGSSQMNYRWWRNGVLTSETGAALTIPAIQPADTGLYVAEAKNEAGATATEPAVVGILSGEKVTGGGEVRGTAIRHPNGNFYDQILLTGPAATVTGEPGKVTRTSFIDLDGDIVQVEFAGAGALSVVLAAAGELAPPVKYNQTEVRYVSGHAGIVIVGADESTNVSVFTVGRATAFDPTGAYDLSKAITPDNDPANNGNPLFQGHPLADYDGVADIAFIAISSANGKFGGVRTANAVYQNGVGMVGLYAPGVEFLGPVFIGDIRGSDDASAGETGARYPSVGWAMRGAVCRGRDTRAGRGCRLRE